MAKTKEQKAQIVKTISDKLAKMKATVFVNFNQLTVKEVEELRRQCRQAKVDYLVVKKNLLRLALSKSQFKDITLPEMSEGIAVAFSYDDEIAPARVLGRFAKKNKKVKLTGGIFENQFIDLAKVTELANLPGKEELLAKLVGSLRSPLAGIVGVLQGNLRKLALVLNAIKDSR